MRKFSFPLSILMFTINVVLTAQFNKNNPRSFSNTEYTTDLSRNHSLGYSEKLNFYPFNNSTKIFKREILDKNFLLSEILWKYWNGNDWIDQYTYSYTYNEDNLIEILQKKNSLDSGWLNDIKESYYYDDNNNNIERVIHYWDGSEWANKRKHNFTYDEKNNLIEDIEQR